jgi:hypothetical protein
LHCSGLCIFNARKSHYVSEIYYEEGKSFRNYDNLEQRETLLWNRKTVIIMPKASATCKLSIQLIDKDDTPLFKVKFVYISNWREYR